MRYRLRAIVQAQLESHISLTSQWAYNTRGRSTMANIVLQGSVVSLENNSGGYHFHTQLNPRFSAIANPTFDPVAMRDWSQEVERIEKWNLEWNHESVLYVMKKVEKDGNKLWNFFNWVTGRVGFKPNFCCYSVLLRALVRMDSKKLFWLALGKMKQQMVHVDDETLATLLIILRKEKRQSDVNALKDYYRTMAKENEEESKVKTILALILEGEWSSTVENHLQQVVVSMNDGFFIRVLRNLCNQPRKAVSFFRWISRLEFYEHNAITYNGILRVLCRDDSMDEFWRFVEEMREANFHVDIDTYTKLSRKLQKSRRIEDAVKLFIFMMDGPFKPSLQNCQLLIRSISHTQNPDLELVDRIVKKYEKESGFQSKTMYDVVHRSLTSAGKFDEAKKVVSSMRLAGHYPDNITWSQLIFGLCKSNKLEEAGKVILEMEGENCAADIKTWTILIQGHCATNQTDKAYVYFEKMVDAGCEPDADVLQVLVEGLVAENRADEATSLLFDFVEKRDVRPLRHTFELLICKHLGNRKLDDALNLLRLMKANNHSPSADAFVSFISKYGTVEDANKFLKAFSVKESASIAAYRHLFEALLRENRILVAKDLLFMSPYHVRKHSRIFQLFASKYDDKVT